MSRVTIKLNKSGVGEFLKGPEMTAITTELAQSIAKRAGDGYEADSYVGKTRVNASVYPATFEATRDNNRNNTLLKSLR